VSQSLHPYKLASDFYSVATSPNGWTDTEIGYAWFEKCFVPYATSKKVTADPIVLYVDGHDSHETDHVRKIGFDNHVIVIAFPSKCTHKLQPLDVVVFAQSQRSWTTHCNRRLIEGVRMTRYNVVQEYMKIRGVMTSKLIQSAFRCCGIHPFNPSIFTEEDFAPSKLSSTQSHTPTSFPQEIPSSPTAMSSSEPEEDPLSEHSDFDIGVIDWDTDSQDGDYILPNDDNPVDRTTPTMPMHPATVSQVSTRSTPSFGNLHKSSSSSAVSANAMLSRHQISPSDAHSGDRRTYEEMQFEIRKLQYSKQLLENEVLSLKGQLVASNAHCTVINRAVTETRTELENQKKKTRRSVKTQSRFVTHPELKAVFKAEMAEKEAQGRQAAEKEAQKVVEDAARAEQINEDTASKIFTGSLSSYKRKDDLIVLAGALGLSTGGTVVELTSRIKSHVEDHPELAQNTRFAGLFQRGRRARGEDVIVENVATATATVPAVSPST
jgi:DDE superfamily endonuclease